MPKVTYTSAKGLVQETGSGISLTSDSIVLSSMPTSTVQAVTTSATVTAPGVYTISGSTGNGILEVVVPLASSVPGGLFVFRAASADAHYITGSSESVGTRVFKGFYSGSDGAQQPQGSKVTLTGFIGNSVSFLSDGKNYCLLAASGSVAFAN